MSTCKVILNEQTLMDVTDTTAEAAEVLAGEYFYAADGTRTLGTASGGGDEAITARVYVDPEGVGCFVYDENCAQSTEVDVVFYEGIDHYNLTVFVPGGESIYAEVDGPGDYTCNDSPTGDTNGDGEYEIHVLTVIYEG